MFVPALSLFCFAFVFILDRPQELVESSPITDNATSATDNTAMPKPNENPLTSHVLDTAVGRPAVGVKVVLWKEDENGEWRHITEQLTNDDGRIGNLISAEQFTPGRYRLHFDTMSYYANRTEKTFYPYIDVAFQIENPEEHYHVPILLSAYGFSTYRGS